jgi:hypothetical protein
MRRHFQQLCWTARCRASRPLLAFVSFVALQSWAPYFSLHFLVAVLVHRGPLFPNLNNVFRSMSNLIFPVYKAGLAKFEHAAGRTRLCYNSQNHATGQNPAVSICIVLKITRVSILNTYCTPSKVFMHSTPPHWRPLHVISIGLS